MFKILYSLFFIIIGWVIFRVENINDLFNILKIMFSFNNTALFDLFKDNSLLVNTIPYILLGIVFSTPIYKWFKKHVDNSKGITLTVVEDIILGILFGVSIMFLVSNSYNPFIYFRF